MKKTNKPASPEEKNNFQEELLKTQEALAKATAELEEKSNAHLRALADYHNLERRSGQMYASAIKSAQAKMLQEILHLKQDVDRAEKFDTTGSWKLISQKFDTMLANLGVSEIDALGKEFSPDTMEAIEVVEGDTDNIVTKVHEKGYMHGESLLKPARVAVSKKKEIIN